MEFINRTCIYFQVFNVERKKVIYRSLFWGTDSPSELVEIFCAFCGPTEFNIMLARAHHCTVTRARGFEFTSSCTLCVTFILILSSHLYLRLLNDFLPSALQTTNVYACLCIPKGTVCPSGFFFRCVRKIAESGY